MIIFCAVCATLLMRKVDSNFFFIYTLYILNVVIISDYSPQQHQQFSRTTAGLSRYDIQRKRRKHGLHQKCRKTCSWNCTRTTRQYLGVRPRTTPDRIRSISEEEIYCMVNLVLFAINIQITYTIGHMILKVLVIIHCLQNKKLAIVVISNIYYTVPALLVITGDDSNILCKILPVI